MAGLLEDIDLERVFSLTKLQQLFDEVTDGRPETVLRLVRFDEGEIITQQELDADGVLLQAYSIWNRLKQMQRDVEKGIRAVNGDLLIDRC